MKEFYIAPEVKRLAFRPQEELAAGGNFDDLLGATEPGTGGGSQFPGTNLPGSETEIDPGDVGLPV